MTKHTSTYPGTLVMPDGTEVKLGGDVTISGPSGMTSVPGYVLVCFVIVTNQSHISQPLGCGC